MDPRENWTANREAALEELLDSVGYYEAEQNLAVAKAGARRAVTLLCPRCGRRLADARWEPGMPGDFWVTNEHIVTGRTRYKSQVVVYTLRDGVTTKVRIKCQCSLDTRLPFDLLVRVCADAIEHRRERIPLPAPSAA